MDTIIIRPKSQKNFDSIIALMNQLDEKFKILSDKTFTNESTRADELELEEFLLQKMKQNQKSETLSKKEIEDFLNELKNNIENEI
ncbi:hypothetical protein FACS1894174_04750 [Bacteroidia bacterium]|nr:hypothetical protein FACS1894155_04480 [Bacteroidia bacterium]GHV21400.1 hypothetical protein FACS1894174_04750 [Bacteroidia bacterium]